MLTPQHYAAIISASAAILTVTAVSVTVKIRPSVFAPHYLRRGIALYEAARLPGSAFDPMANEIILTESSFKKLQEELEHMKTVKRAEMAEALRKARSFGDLSENFEYHAARRDQGILNGKIADLEKKLEMARVVPDEVHASDEVGLGAIVMIRDLETDDEWEYHIVDALLADPVNDKISVHSPVAEALAGKKVGEVVEVPIPDGTARYEILNIRHE